MLVDTGQWKLLKELLAAMHAWITSHLIAWSRAKYYHEQLIINSTREPDSGSDGDEGTKEEDKEDKEEVEGWESGPLDWRLQAVRSII